MISTSDVSLFHAREQPFGVPSEETTGNLASSSSHAGKLKSAEEDDAARGTLAARARSSTL
jgi:hypothetical protein